MSQHKRSLVVSLLGACALLFGFGLLLAQPSGAEPSGAAPSAPASTSAAPSPTVIDDSGLLASATPSLGIGGAHSTASPEPSYSIGDAISTSRAVPSYGIGPALSTSRPAPQTKPVAARPRTSTRTSVRSSTQSSTSAAAPVARHVEVAHRGAIVGPAPAGVHEDGVARTGRPIIEYVLIGLLFVAAGSVVYVAARRYRSATS
jgi:hypothetical protein